MSTDWRQGHELNELVRYLGRKMQNELEDREWRLEACLRWAPGAPILKRTVLI